MAAEPGSGRRGPAIRHDDAWIRYVLASSPERPKIVPVVGTIRQHLEVVFPRRRQVRWEPCHAPAPGAEEVRVRALCSLISTGTEMTALNQRFAEGRQWACYVGEAERLEPDVVNWSDASRSIVGQQEHLPALERPGGARMRWLVFPSRLQP